MVKVFLRQEFLLLETYRLCEHLTISLLFGSVVDIIEAKNAIQAIWATEPMVWNMQYLTRE